MKSVIRIFIIALFLPLALQAQTKKVVMLEPLGTDSTLQKTMIREKLAEAFTHSGKYKASFRADIDRLMNEFNFQQSGMLNDAQRKQLKQMSDADLMCITKLTSEEDASFMEVNLIELKNGKIFKTANQLTLNTPVEELEEGCLQLAAKVTGKVTLRRNASDKHRNGELYNPDGIELVYVSGAGAIKSFYIGKYEITQTQWKVIMGNNPSSFKGNNLPVENVSWNDIQRFLAKLNAVTKKSYRLPTETEWEFAARGGTAISFCDGRCIYSGGNKIDRVAWYKKNSKNHTHAVGSKAPNELGIYDMTGNVWEWCEDFYDKTSHRNVRGGSWFREAKNCRTDLRGHESPEVRSYNIGFRVILPVK